MQIIPILTAVLLAPPTPDGGRIEDLGPAREFKVLYAGFPGGERERRFLEFLRPWFTAVDSISLKDLDARRAAPYDVIITDWKRRYSNGKYGSVEPHQRMLADDYSKPTILLGAVAGEIQEKSKINWL